MLENTWDIVGMSPVMLGSLAANAFPLQMYGTRLKEFWMETQNKVDDRVMTRHTYGNRFNQTLNMDNTYIPIDELRTKRWNS